MSKSSKEQLFEFECSLLDKSKEISKRQNQLYKKKKIDLINLIIEVEQWFNIKLDTPLMRGKFKEVKFK